MAANYMTIADLTCSAPFFRLTHNKLYENSHILEVVIDKYPNVKTWMKEMITIFKPFIDSQNYRY